jgi:hypothetical protein
MQGHERQQQRCGGEAHEHGLGGQVHVARRFSASGEHGRPNLAHCC